MRVDPKLWYEGAMKVRAGFAFGLISLGFVGNANALTAPVDSDLDCRQSIEEAVESIDDDEEEVEERESFADNLPEPRELVEEAILLYEDRLVEQKLSNPAKASGYTKKLRDLAIIYSILFEGRRMHDVARSEAVSVPYLRDRIRAEWESILIYCAAEFGKVGYDSYEGMQSIVIFFDRGGLPDITREQQQKSMLWQRMRQAMFSNNPSAQDKRRRTDLREALSSRRPLEQSIDKINQRFPKLKPLTMKDAYDEMDLVHLDWVKKHGGTLPSMEDYSTVEGKLGISYERFFDRRGKRRKKLSHSEIILNIAKKALANKQAYYVFTRRLDFESPAEQEIHLAVTKELLLISLVAHLEANPDIKVLDKKHFGTKPGQFPISLKSLVMGRAVAQVDRGFNFFETEVEFHLAVKKAVEEYGKASTEYHLLELPTQGLFPVDDESLAELRTYWRNELLLRVQSWIETNAEELVYSVNKMFGTKEGQIHFSSQRVVPKSSRVKPETVLFDSMADFFLSLRELYSDQGREPPSIFNFRFQELTEELREIRREDAIRLIARFILAHGYFPQVKDFSSDELPFHYSLLFGHHQSPDNGIFYQIEMEFWNGLLSELKANKEWEQLSEEQRSEVLNRMQAAAPQIEH